MFQRLPGRLRTSFSALASEALAVILLAAVCVMLVPEGYHPMRLWFGYYTTPNCLVIQQVILCYIYLYLSGTDSGVTDKCGDCDKAIGIYQLLCDLEL